ncbi:MAG: hypothetical protein BRC45_07370 [Cyanobacteria bacterium QS_5_48_63]|nr:MAG: hypothetical protein BRC45_07370 [Cyanobacteria bacterium QS_5_48_63]
MGVFRLFLEGGGERLGSGEARRWSKDYERFPETEEAFIYSARLRCWHYHLTSFPPTKAKRQVVVVGKAALFFTAAQLSSDL